MGIETHAKGTGVMRTGGVVRNRIGRAGRLGDARRSVALVGQVSAIGQSYLAVERAGRCRCIASVR